MNAATILNGRVAPAIVLVIIGAVCAVAMSQAFASSDGNKPAHSTRGSEDLCQTDLCSFVTTQQFDSTTAGDLVSSATPIDNCPEAAAAYGTVGREVSGFFGPCPTAEQIDDLHPLRSMEKASNRRARAAFRDIDVRRARRATLTCPPDCVGTSGNDNMSGDSSANDMRGAGGDDIIQTWAGPDIGRGEGGTDFIQVNVGNGEIARGGDNGSDASVVWGDSGKDYAYGGNGDDDICYVDVTDELDSSCEITNLP